MEDRFEGMKARIIQHEYDHIEGKMFVDYLTPLRKRLLKGKLADISKGNVETEYRIMAPLEKVALAIGYFLVQFHSFPR